MACDQAAFDEFAAKMNAYSAAAADHPNRSARDWAGFFQGLAAFIAALAPVIVPLFMSPDKKDDAAT